MPCVCMCSAADLSGRGCADKQTNKHRSKGTGSARECWQDGWNATSKKCKGDSKCIFKGAKGLGQPLPHLHWDWAHPAHISTGTGPTLPTSPPGLGPVPVQMWAGAPCRKAPGRFGERQAGVRARLPAVRLIHRRLNQTRPVVQGDHSSPPDILELIVRKIGSLTLLCAG